ncbi:hypothetical protein RB195_024619 [Necator americanus]|uniref:FAM91 C-terminal domain-containing protein n=1 Tax=Necator americanus TaxID=51031 RepID=A0ABR1ENW9_NECAM
MLGRHVSSPFEELLQCIQVLNTEALGLLLHRTDLHLFVDNVFSTPSGLPENDVVLPIFSSRAIKESGQLMVTSHHPSLFSFGKAEEHPNPPLQAPLLCDPVEEIIIEEITLETNENGKGDTTT